MADSVLTKTLARQIKHQINAGTEAAPLWYDINGLTGMTGSGPKTDADTTTADEEGVESHIVAARGKIFSLTGLRGYINLATGVRDPGQVECEAAAAIIGPAGLKQFRRILPDGVGTCETMLASFNIASDGGNLNDANQWSLEVKRSGATTTTELGAVPDTPTAVIGTAGVLQVSVAYVVDADPAPDYAEVFIYDAATDEEVAYGKDDPATTPLVVTGLLAQPYYARVRAVSATGAISPLSAASAEFTPTAS